MGNEQSRPQENIDLIEIFQNTRRNRQNDALVSASKQLKAAMFVEFMPNGERRISIDVEKEFKNIETWIFFPISTKSAAEVGLVTQYSTYCGFVYHDPKDNGLQLIATRLFEILNDETKIEVVFKNDKSTIDEMCNIEAIFKARKFVIKKPLTSQDELDFISQKFESLESIHLDTEVPPGYETFALNYKTAYIARKTALKLEDLKTMRCDSLTIFESELTSIDMNLFIKSWMAGVLSESFKCLYIIKFVKTEELLEGLDIKPWDPSTRTANYQFPSGLVMECSKSMDLIREDGALASIWSNPGSFIFTVWHQRFRDVAGEYAHPLFGD